MAARRGTRFPVSRGRKNDYDWEGVTTLSLALAASGVTTAVVFLADQSETLVRMRGEVLVWLDASGSAQGDACVVACGLIVASLGSTQAVDPINEGGANWLWHSFFTLATESAIANAVTAPDSASRRLIIDNKAMRKLREDEEIQFIVANQDIAGAPVVNVVAGLRALTAR